MNGPTEIKGYNGQLLISENKLTIKRKGLGGFLAKGAMSGDKEIPIKSITAIEFKNANMLTNGFIQFSIHGEMGDKRGGVRVASDENTILFTKSQQDSFVKAKATIEDLIAKAEKTSQTVVNNVSAADELKKFAALKEEGLITEEEYQMKKKELLGL
jgi:hypothetical protein